MRPLTPPARRTLLAILLFTLLLPLAARASVQSDAAARIASPDGRTEVEFALGRFGDGAPAYRVLRDGRVLIDWSPLGLRLRGRTRDERDLDQGFILASAREEAADETWTFNLGKNSTIRDHYRALAIRLRRAAAPYREIEIVFRAYDDGAAFRYILPEQEGLAEIGITSEETRFNFPADHRILVQKPPTFMTSYSGPYRPGRLSGIGPGGKAQLPILLEVEGGPRLSLMEAALTDYPGLHLAGERAQGAYGLRANLPSNILHPGVKALGRTPFATPWRMLMIGDGIGDLIESDLVLNLNEPCALPDPGWIKPGKAAWPWWSGSHVEGAGFRGGMNTATFKHYTDFAAASGFEYLVVDAGWYGPMISGDITRPIKAVDLEEVIRYARERGVGVFLWLHWIPTARRMDEAFPLYEKWGVAGVKVDYLWRDDQSVVRFCTEMVAKAAKHHLMVDIHGGYKPTGTRRTYPNLITQEAVRGLECNKWTAWCDPEHDVTLAYTRLLAGEMDYTPGGFNNVARRDFRASYKKPMTLGTRGHQLALYVVYESPLQMVSDYPAAYADQPGFEFIRAVPTVWDETRFVAGTVGDYIVLARRKGDTWYLGAINDWTAREVEIPLAFLGGGGYRAEIYADGEDADTRAKSLRVSEIMVTRDAVLRIRLAAGGGMAGILAPDAAGVETE